MTHKEPKGWRRSTVEALLPHLGPAGANRIILRFEEVLARERIEAKREVLEGIKKRYENEPYLYHYEIDEYASSLGIALKDNK